MKDPTTALDAMIILGYTLNSDGTLHPLLISRLNKAVSLYKPGRKIILTGKMPPHSIKPDRCEQITEAAAMKSYLLKQDVLNNDLYLEEHSLTTFTNLFYARTQFLDPMKITSVTVVSNAFHTSLVEYCCNVIFGNMISFHLTESSDEGLEKSDTTLWETVSENLISTLYPPIFKNIKPGDITAISNIIKDANSKNPSPERRIFEKEFRKLLGISDSVSLTGIL